MAPMDSRQVIHKSFGKKIITWSKVLDKTDIVHVFYCSKAMKWVYLKKRLWKYHYLLYRLYLRYLILCLFGVIFLICQHIVINQTWCSRILKIWKSVRTIAYVIPLRDSINFEIVMHLKILKRKKEIKVMWEWWIHPSFNTKD